VLRGVPAGARVLEEPVPGPVLALVEVATEDEAIAIAREARGAVSVWSRDPGHAERIARTLPAELTWVNEHGFSAPAAAVRIARHVEVRQLESHPLRLRTTRWLPYDPALVRASTAVSLLRHGRETDRVASLRAGAVPLARTAGRMAREALRR
ncbi:MAG: aldehyde dehydrogenase family protein, partial [Actinomycetota bacterium]|nr:aldehyde dehydrogenase family protein [Actinomycetota bacterium]